MPNSRPILLVAPLNWGMGHATRLVPILYEANKLNYDILVMASSPLTEFLKSTCPFIRVIDDGLPPVKWHIKKQTAVGYARLAIAMMIRSLKEHRLVKKIHGKYHFNLILSDNRYGVYLDKVPSIFITHQFQLKLPVVWRWIEPGVNRLLRLRYRKFDEVWIPDSLNQSLAGELSLSGRDRKSTYFIGPLSRYTLVKEQAFPVAFDVLILLAGPEPARTTWRLALEELFSASSYKVCFAQNKPQGERSFVTERSFHCLYNGSGAEIKGLIQRTPLVISRAGYSSIMDFAILGKPALLVPTPRQTEQLYLAAWLEKHPLFTVVDSAQLTLDRVQKAMMKKLPEPPPVANNGAWKQLLKRKCEEHGGKAQ